MVDRPATALPNVVSDFLSGTYYAISIAAILISLIAWSVVQQTKISELDRLEREHPTRSELAQVAVQVDYRLGTLERRLEDLDVHGTRALADRTTLLEQSARTMADTLVRAAEAQEKSLQELRSRLTDLQQTANKLGNDAIQVVERQHVNSEKIRDLEHGIDELQRRAYGERGPTAPANYPALKDHDGR